MQAGLRATPGARFRALVDSQLAGTNNYGFQAWYAALMYRLTGEARYGTYAVAKVDKYVAEEEARIAANQRADVAFDSYLYVGDVLGDLALVYDWCRPLVTDSQRTRWVAYANTTLANVWNPTGAKWGATAYPWSGWSINNPGNNYYYSFLEATMLVALATAFENAQAAAWRTKARDEKIGAQAVPYFTRSVPQGGSREGTGYGTAMMRLFKLYLWWEASTGERIADLTPHTRASIAHMLHSIVPTLDRIAPTGDHARDSSASLFDYHRTYLLTLAQLYPTDVLSGAAKSLLASSSVPRVAQGMNAWADFMFDPENVAAAPLERLARGYHSAGTGQFYVRGDWTRQAAFAAFNCGPFDEAHAHRDQGGFVIHRGAWLATDANTFTHSGIQQGEALHNLVRVEQAGEVVRQKAESAAGGGRMLALADTALYAYALADITPVYDGKPQIVRQEREFLFLRPGTFVVFDRVRTAGAGIARIWTLNTAARPTVSGAVLTVIEGASRLDVTHLAPGVVPETVSWPTVDPDIKTGHRTDYAHTAGDGCEFLHVLSTDGDVASAVRSDAAGMIGAAITFADGRQALVRFSVEGRGGSVEVRAAGGAVIHSGALPSGVQSLPLLAN